MTERLFERLFERATRPIYGIGRHYLFVFKGEELGPSEPVDPDELRPADEADVEAAKQDESLMRRMLIEVPETSGRTLIADANREAIENTLSDHPDVHFGDDVVYFRASSDEPDLTETLLAVTSNYPVLDDQWYEKIEREAEEEAWEHFVAEEYALGLLDSYPDDAETEVVGGWNKAISSIPDETFRRLFEQSLNDSDTQWETNHEGVGRYVDGYRVAEFTTPLQVGFALLGPWEGMSLPDAVPPGVTVPLDTPPEVAEDAQIAALVLAEAKWRILLWLGLGHVARRQDFDAVREALYWEGIVVPGWLEPFDEASTADKLARMESGVPLFSPAQTVQAVADALIADPEKERQYERYMGALLTLDDYDEGLLDQIEHEASDAEVATFVGRQAPAVIEARQTLALLWDRGTQKVLSNVRSRDARV